jgi:hypothetical protein
MCGSRRVMLAAMVGPLLLGCGGARRPPKIPPATAEGVYEYSLRIPRREIHGTFAVAGETTALKPDGDECRWRSNDRRMSFECVGHGFDLLVLYIDPFKPMESSAWVLTYRTQRLTRVCETSFTARDGSTMCSRWASGSQETLVTDRGKLQVKRYRS